jgi:hypothetical protein
MPIAPKTIRSLGATVPSRPKARAGMKEGTARRPAVAAPARFRKVLRLTGLEDGFVFFMLIQRVLPLRSGCGVHDSLVEVIDSVVDREKRAACCHARFHCLHTGLAATGAKSRILSAAG